MNDNNFRFVTRTRYTDYKVYINGGRDTISNREGFRPFRQKCGITEGEQCACIFAENGKIYLVVSALDRHKTDERGRAIRFSFCQVFTNKQHAASAFIKLADHWEDVEAWLSQNFHDIDEGTEAEGVELNESAFMKWLVNDGEEFDSDNWLRKGEVLKWTKRDGKEDYIPIAEVFDPVNVDYVGNSSGSKKKIVAGVVILSVIGGCYVLGPKKNVEYIQETTKPIDDVANNLSQDIIQTLEEQGRNSAPGDSRDVKNIAREAINNVPSLDISGDKGNSSSQDSDHD